MGRRGTFRCAQRQPALRLLGWGQEWSEKREAAKYWQKQTRILLDAAGFPNATSHKFCHSLAIEMISHGATFEDVAAALGNTVGVVAKSTRMNGSKSATGRRMTLSRPLGRSRMYDRRSDA
jgi:hypothetical protein